MGIVGRAQLNHPAQSTAGGPTLYTSINTIYTNVSDDLAGRFITYTSLANSSVTTITHGFGVAFSDIKFYLYSGTYPALTRLATTGWTIAANVTNPKTQIDITAPSSGGPFTGAFWVVHGKGAEQLSDLSDINFGTAPQDGQALVYDAGTAKWLPGASGDASFKLQSVTTPNLSLKGGYLLETYFQRELASYSGSGSTSTSFGVDLTVSLTTILGTAPANATTYFLYVDLKSLTGPTTQTDTGRIVYPITISNLVLFTLNPEAVDRSRYLALGYIRSATTGTVWSGTGAAFGSTAKFRHQPTNVHQAGEINLLTHPFTAGGWTSSGAGMTVATTMTTAELPLDGVFNSGIKITPVSGTTDKVYSRFTMPASLKNTKLKAEWFQRFLTSYASNDLKFEIYTNTLSDYSGTYVRLALSTDSSAVTGVPASTGKFSTSFDSDSSDYYEVRFMRVAGTSALVVTNLIVGPGVQPQGSVVSAWQSYTPTLTGFGTPSISSSEWRRNGESIDVKVNFISGTMTAATAAVSLPAGFTTSMGNAAGYAVIVGMWVRANSGATQVKNGPLTCPTAANSTVLNFAYYEYTTAAGFQTAQLANNIIGTTEIVELTFTVKVNELVGNGVVNLAQNDVEFAYNTTTADSNDTTSFGYGPGGVAFGSYTSNSTAGARTKRVRFQTPIQSGEVPLFEVSSDGVRFVPVDETFMHLQYANTAIYGVRLSVVNATDVDVLFGNSGASPANVATYGGNNGDPWSGYTAFFWRVRKAVAKQAVGFGQVTQLSAGLVKRAGQLLGTNTNDVAAAGNVAELFSFGGNSASLTSGAFSDFTSFNLTPGEWDIEFHGWFNNGSGLTGGQIGVSTTSGNSATGLVDGQNQSEFGFTGTRVAVSIPRYPIQISTNTTYYFKLTATFGAGTGTFRGFCSARRAR